MLIGNASLPSVWPRLVQCAVGDDAGNFTECEKELDGGAV